MAFQGFGHQNGLRAVEAVVGSLADGLESWLLSTRVGVVLKLCVDAESALKAGASLSTLIRNFVEI